MKGVDGHWGLEVTVGGRDLGLDPTLLNHFYIINNIHQQLPTINFSFKDSTGKHLDSAMTDGAPISVSIGVPGMHMYDGLNFRIMGMPSVNTMAAMNNIKLNGVFDRVNFLKKVVDKPYIGSASTAIAQIAGEVGLIPDVDATMDAMAWLPNRTSLAQYAQHIMERSYAGASNAMIMAITDSGKLRFKGLNQIIQGSFGKVLSSDPSKGINMLWWGTDSKAPASNSAGGYGMTTIGQNMDGTVTELNKVAMTMMSGALSSVSSTMQGFVGQIGSRINVLAPLAGNTHDKWYEGIHQNQRIKSSYGFDMEVLTDQPTQLELLDAPTVLPYNMGTGELATEYAGKYMVTALTRMITHNRYMEKLVLTAQGAGGL
jgi:hypothetical protein